MDPQDVINAVGCRLEIANDAAEHDYVPRLLRDNGLVGDEWVGLFDCAGVQALDLAGGARWQSTFTSAAWASMVASFLGET